MQVFSIFQSIDGEVNAWGQGIPSTFIRLSGCNQQCSYCDVPEAQDRKAGQAMTVDEVFNIIKNLECPKITITGGEPLLQEDEIHQLLNRLFTWGFKVSIETNGSRSTRRFREVRKPHENVCLVVDYKIGGGYCASAFEFLREWDWVKIVVGHRTDFEKAKSMFGLFREMGCKARFALSPIHETLPGKELAQWIIDAKLWDVTLNVQIHKFLDLA